MNVHELRAHSVYAFGFERRECFCRTTSSDFLLLPETKLGNLIGLLDYEMSEKR